MTRAFRGGVIFPFFDPHTHSHTHTHSHSNTHTNTQRNTHTHTHTQTHRHTNTHTHTHTHTHNQERGSIKIETGLTKMMSWFKTNIQISSVGYIRWEFLDVRVVPTIDVQRANVRGADPYIPIFPL